MTNKTVFPALALAVWALGCSDSPTEAHDHELIVDFAMSTEHVHTLEEITFTVTVTDDHGDYVTDFTTIQVERELEGTATWRSIELVLQGTAYVGTYTFTSSGDYHFRVVGMRPSDTEAQVLYESPEHVEVVRAHEVVGSSRVEFESFPGHIHAGSDVVVRFWIMESERNAAGERPPITGLNVVIECGNPDLTSEMHTVTDNGDGIYEATHNFAEGGEGHIEIRFTDTAGVEQEVDFHVHIVAAH